MNQKLIFGLIVVVIVGVVVSYQLLYRPEPVVQAPAAPPTQAPQPSPSPTRPTAAEIVRSCIGDGAYLEGTDRRFSSIVELGKPWTQTPELSNLVVAHPIVCPLTERYELVYRFHTEEYQGRQVVGASKLYVRDRQLGQETLLTEHGPSLGFTYAISSGRITGIFLTMRPNGIFDFSHSAFVDTGGGTSHALFNPRTGAVLEYSLEFPSRGNSSIGITKGNRKWVVNPVVTEHVTGAGVSAVGTVVVKGIAVNGTLIKKFDVERKTSVATDASAFPSGAGGLNYGIGFGTSRRVSVKEGYHTLDDVYVNDDFSKMMFTVKLSVQNPTGGAETVDLGRVEINLR